MTETQQTPHDRVRRLPEFDLPDSALFFGIAIGTVSWAGIWWVLGGIFLSIALILYALRAG